MMRWSRLSVYAVGVAIPLLFACSGEVHDHDNFREDVVQCEEAVSYVSECCGGAFDPMTVTCQHAYDYIPGSCDTPSKTTSENPDWSLAVSNCILHQSCADMTKNGKCEPACVRAK